MKNFITLLFSLTIFTQISANLNFYTEASLLDHMLEVNAEWKHWGNENFNFQLKFDSEESRINTHLLLAIKTLENTDVSHLTKVQIENRFEALEGLKEYANKKSFPINSSHNIRIPYFIDHNNTACAVGQMIRNSDQDEIGQWIKSELNNAYVAEIPFGKLDAWAEEYGFSREELAWIQPGYPPSLEGWTSMNQGVNGAAKTLIEYDGKLIIAGEFTDASGLSVNNVVAWNGNNFEALGDGVNGWVNCSIIYQGKLTLGGSFNAGFADIAIWDGETWEYQTAFASKFGETQSLGIYLDKLYAGGYASGFAGIDAILAIWENPNWNWVAEFEHENLQTVASVNSIVQLGNEMLIGGDFLSVNVFGDITEAKNIAKFNNQGIWEEYNEGLNGFVKDIQIDNGNVIVAGKIKEGDDDYFGLAYSAGSEWQTIIDENAFYSNFLSGQEIAYFNKVHFEEGDSTVCGIFSTSFGMTTGESFAKIASQGGWTSGAPSFSTNGEIHDFLEYQGYMYVAGEFENLTGTEFNNVAFFDSPNSTNEIDSEIFVLYPNPVDDSFVLDLQIDSKIEAVYLFDQSGKRIQLNLNENAKPYRFNIDNLAKGVYTLQVITNNGEFNKQLIKN